MRDYIIDSRNVQNPLYKAPIEMGQTCSDGRSITIGNYFLEFNGKPYFAICGEAHFSRINPELWEDEIIKMKEGGLNIIATYIFWIHHEEIEGVFDWKGGKNLRRFLELCKNNGMNVILRIGPFSHGECRNGGFPDWMFGRPFDIRTDDPEYLAYTRTFYKEIFNQAKGLLFKDNGPVIGVQLENEHEHASCPWEMTTENSKEWVVSGRNGKEHMATLKRIAKETGFDVPLYTATAWGGACAPEETVFPLWGGYAFRPWMFYDGTLKEHPATAEYIYGDFHNNSAPSYYNFDPEYKPEDYPYACCEMGGGMNVYYPYRFQLPYESVGALAQVKVGSGCNFLGYYMYHGGTHPRGKKVEYLNECAVPKFSYDYQAPIGEFGQIRKSFHQLKCQHYFYKEFEDLFSKTKTVLSEEAKRQIPEDVETLRYLVRIDENGRGFLFINNYQDHVDCIPQKDFSVTVRTDLGDVRIPEAGYLDIEKECYAILPVNLDISGITCHYATAQLITETEFDNKKYYFFTAVEGMRTEFVFGNADISCLKSATVVGNKVLLEKGEGSFEIRKDGVASVIVVLSVKDSLRLWQIDYMEKRYLFLSDCPILLKDNRFEIEYPTGADENIAVFPPLKTIRIDGNEVSSKSEDIFSYFDTYKREKAIDFEFKDVSSKNSGNDGVLKRPVVGSPVSSTKIVNARATLKFKESDFEGLKQLIVKIEYDGDVGYAFINGEMFHDNFANGSPWEIDILPYKDEILKNGMYIYIAPRKVGAYVDNSSAMAARFEVTKEQFAKIHSISALGIRKVPIDF